MRVYCMPFCSRACLRRLVARVTGVALVCFGTVRKASRKCCSLWHCGLGSSGCKCCIWRCYTWCHLLSACSSAWYTNDCGAVQHYCIRILRGHRWRAASSAAPSYNYMKYLSPIIVGHIQRYALIHQFTTYRCQHWQWCSCHCASFFSNCSSFHLW